MWAAAQWLDAQGLLDARQRQQMFARTAGVIAPGYADARTLG